MRNRVTSIVGPDRPPQTWIALVVLVGAFGCGGGNGAAAPTPAPTPSATPAADVDGWSALANSPAGEAQQRHDDVFFLDESRGWLVNIRGEVFRTTDGGMSWLRSNPLPTGVTPRCVGFGSALQGWLGTIDFRSTAGGLALFETTDGGVSWSNVSSRISGAVVPGLCGMRVLGPSTVVAVGRWHGPAVFVKTTDGGVTWTSRNLDADASGLVDLFFFNEREGFAVGSLGDGRSEAVQRAARTVILATADGGETWENRYTSAAVGQRAWKIQFVTTAVGYVTTEGATPEGVVLKTADGGRTWQKSLVGAGLSFEGVGFVSADRGWVGSGESLYATSDGGTTWRRVGFGRSINRMRVLSADLVLACGDRVYRWRP